MGAGKFDFSSYADTTRGYAFKTREEVFTSRGLNDAVDPAKLKFGKQESRDSDVNPQSTPVMVFSDVTGSMGFTAERMIREWLGRIMHLIYEKKPITDPHMLCGAIGDQLSDQAPLQVTQFEADDKAITDQLSKIWIEGNGGGNGGESYPLAWWFANNCVVADSIEKRGQKGYLFTIGDERYHPTAPGTTMMKVGRAGAPEFNAAEEYKKCLENWEVFHFVILDHQDKPLSQWKALMNERAIYVPDVEKLPELIVSIIAAVERLRAQNVSINDNVLIEHVNKALPGNTGVLVR